MRHYLICTWLPVAIASTIIVVTIYAVAQQSIRQAANDPQIQLAEDGAATLAAGYSPYAIVGNSKVDISSSLAPFIVIYDESGQVVASTGFLNDRAPVLPRGVFDYVKTTGTDDRITWQPASTTRLAAVVRHYSGMSSGSSGKAISGYIVAARSLREVEIRENFVALAAGGALILLLIVTFVVSLLSYVYSSSVPNKVS